MRHQSLFDQSPPFICPSCGADAAGAYCNRCGDPLGIEASRLPELAVRHLLRNRYEVVPRAEHRQVVPLSLVDSVSVVRNIRPVFSTTRVLYAVVHKAGSEPASDRIREAAKEQIDTLAGNLPVKERSIDVMIEHIHFDESSVEKSSAKSLLRRWKFKTLGWFTVRDIRVRLKSTSRLPAFEAGKSIADALNQYSQTQTDPAGDTRRFALAPLFSGLENFSRAMLFAFQPQMLAGLVRDGQVRLRDIVIIISASSLIAALLGKVSGYSIYPVFGIPIIDQLVLLAAIFTGAALITAPIHLWQRRKRRNEPSRLIGISVPIRYFGVSFAVLYPVAIAVGAFLFWVDFEALTGLRVPKTGALIFLLSGFGLAELYGEKAWKMTIALIVVFNLLFWSVLLALS